MADSSFLSQAWVEAGPIADDAGVYVHLPKQNSAAANAGLHSGDAILAIGGQELESWGDLYSAVETTESGEEIKLTMRRAGYRLASGCQKALSALTRI